MQVMNLLICCAVLLVSIVALFSFQVLNFRNDFRRDAETLAVIIANNSTAAMAFKDEQMAAEVLNALHVKPTIIGATLAAPDGRPFGHYGRLEGAESLRQFPDLRASRFVEGQLLITEPVIAKKELLGSLYLRCDYHGMFTELLGFYGQVVLCVVIVASALGMFLSSRLGRSITGPVLQLARTARVVGEKKDYSVRALVASGDEVGRLTESFNEMLARLQKQDAAINLSQQKLEALVNSLDGIVWERVPGTFQFSFVSRQSKALLGYEPETWMSDHDFWVSKLHPQDSAKTIQTVQELSAQGKPYTCEYRMMAADQRAVWIRESGVVLVEQGQPIAVRGILQDVTRQKIDAEQLDKLNRKLIETSRQAGMADVATGVLHNVGNVLNSVSVAATTVSNRLQQQPRIANLRRATAMLKQQNGNLAAFLTSDPKGKVLPDYICTVADELADEQVKLSVRMETVVGHIEHIKEIVAMQQSYAKVSGAYESLEAAELVEDALRLNSAAFDRHGIELVRDFTVGMPRICVDRHKVLQILINVIRNAKYAMDGADAHHKQLVLRIESPSPDRVKIIIRDNGVGIPEEHLTKIFQYGFTTRKEGHGFGLHSGANAAREMGGSLTAHSGGPGKGAEFVLELPTDGARRPQQPAEFAVTA
jgi:nitrogen fixation/metabolism regulation signal transduction histidine kinase